MNLLNSFSKLRKYVVFTSLCHVERPYVNTYSSVSLDYSPSNGVETSDTVKRCFDSVHCELTTLVVNFKHTALVAQHDEMEERMLRL
jgi:hypothetical protein